MRHADAELQLWLANDRIAREQHDAELARLVLTGARRRDADAPAARR